MRAADGEDRGRRRRVMFRGGAPVLAALLAAAPAAAQDGWTFALSPYVWLPGISNSTDTAEGTINVDKSTSDVISDLDFAFMGAAEAKKGKWVLIGDFLYADLTSSAKTPLGRLWKSAEVETKLTATTVYAGYRVLENEKGFIDLLGGGRYFTLDLDLSLEPGCCKGRDTTVSDNWADPVIGARGRYLFNENWYATALADIGGFGGGSDQSWQAFGSVGYQFDERWSVQGGWRYMSVEKEVDGSDVGIDLSGPLVGLTFRF